MAADASARNIIRYSNMTAKDVDNEVDRTYPDNNTNKTERKKYRDNIIHKILMKFAFIIYGSIPLIFFTSVCLNSSGT